MALAATAVDTRRLRTRARRRSLRTEPSRLFSRHPAHPRRPLLSLLTFLAAACSRTKTFPPDAQPIAPVAAEIPDTQLEAGPAVDAASADVCVSLKELLNSDERFTYLSPIKPPIDLDGDGKPDPVFVVETTPWVTVTIFTERGGCARELGSLSYTMSGSFKVLGRDKAGWAILYGHSVKTGQDEEDRAEFDGTRYVTKSRRRLYHPSYDGGVGYWDPWSPWEAQGP